MGAALLAAKAPLFNTPDTFEKKLPSIRGDPKRAVGAPGGPDNSSDVMQVPPRASMAEHLQKRLAGSSGGSLPPPPPLPGANVSHDPWVHNVDTGQEEFEQQSVQAALGSKKRQREGEPKAAQALQRVVRVKIEAVQGQAAAEQLAAAAEGAAAAAVGEAAAAENKATAAEGKAVAAEGKAAAALDDAKYQEEETTTMQIFSGAQTLAIERLIRLAQDADVCPQAIAAAAKVKTAQNNGRH